MDHVPSTLRHEHADGSGRSAPRCARVVAGVGLFGAQDLEPARDRRPDDALDRILAVEQVDADRAESAGGFQPVLQRPPVVVPDERRARHLQFEALLTLSLIFFLRMKYRGHGNVMKSVVARVAGSVSERRFRTQLAVQLDVALGLDVVLAALGHDGHRRPHEQLHVLRHLALAADDLQFSTQSTQDERAPRIYQRQVSGLRATRTLLAVISSC